MPPIHCMNVRHMFTDRGSRSSSASTVAPVVVRPDTDSK